MNLIKLNSVLALGTVVGFRNVRGKVWVKLDYYGKTHEYTTVEIEGML
jgi:hypothetical protein